jgi:hypothetical protein
MPRFVKGSSEAKAWGEKMRALNGIPKLVKGSAEAKAYMAKLRAMRGKK